MKVLELKLDAVYPSVGNTRMDYNGQDMAELIKSIESVGLINPILVRMIDEKGGHEIIAGHRRFHAFKKLGKEYIPARVIEATVDSAMQMRIIENLHRKDLNAIEEAEAFKMLMEVSKLDVKQVSFHTDKGVNYVIRALALLEIPRVAVDAIRAGEMPASHGHQIARAGVDKREALAKFATTRDHWYKRLPTFDELKREIEKKVEKDLSKAVFPKEVEYAGVMACTHCPFNSGNQGALFDGAAKGTCTNPSCFSKKTNTFYKDIAEAATVKFPGVKYLGTASGNWDYDKEFKTFPVVNPKSVADAIKKNPAHFAFGIAKPSDYGRAKKPTLVVVRIHGKVKKQEAQREEKDWEKERFIQSAVIDALRALAANEVDKLEKKHVLQMLDSDGNTDVDDKAIKKMSMDDLLVRLWILSLGTYETANKLKQVGIDSHDLVKEVTKKAELQYAAEKEKKK